MGAISAIRFPVYLCSLHGAISACKEGQRGEDSAAAAAGRTADGGGWTAISLRWGASVRSNAVIIRYLSGPTLRLPPAVFILAAW